MRGHRGILAYSPFTRTRIPAFRRQLQRAHVSVGRRFSRTSECDRPPTPPILFDHVDIARYKAFEVAVGRTHSLDADTRRLTARCTSRSVDQDPRISRSR